MEMDQEVQQLQVNITNCVVKMSGFDFVKTVEGFLEAITTLKSPEEIIDDAWNSCNGNDSDKKSALDQAFREFVAKKMTNAEHHNGDSDNAEAIENGETDSMKISMFKDVIKMMISHAKQKKCTIHLPILLMSDIFDSLTLSECEKLFAFVEENVKIWTTEPFFTPGKNHLLRMCNDILRRLSKSINTIFCGQIQLFLACLFPIEEKSALNIMSQFHTENGTNYKKNKEDFNLEEALNEDGEDGELQDDLNSPIDFNLYIRFWCLQDFFRQPIQCFKPDGWKKFKSYVTEILNVFENYKIEFNEKKRKEKEIDDVTLAEILNTSNKDYFPKYLTNEKLLDLQINDSNFRRYFLVQILILSQYLTGEVKFKLPSHKLLEKQTLWIHEIIDRTYIIMEATPPKGKKFADTVRHILSREENWITWKNEGCSSFAKNKQPLLSKPAPREVIQHGKRKIRAPKRRVGEEFLNNPKKINLGTNELTKLWNLCPDNMEACKAESRLKFLPSLKSYFEEAIKQADPEAGIEDEYKVVNNHNFQWKALRLLARRSNHFFTPSQTPFKALPAYLSSVVDQLGKEFNKSEQEIPKVEIKQEPID